MLDSLMPRLRQAILAATLLHAEAPVYLTELARRLRRSPSSLQPELQALVEAGILERHEDGNRVYFAANERCPVLPELRGLLQKTVGIAGVLAAVLARFGARIRVAFVFGSVAHGTERAASDVDVMVIGDAGLLELTPALREAEDRLGRAVNAAVYAPAEFTARLRKADHFVLSVLGQQKLFLIGGQHELDEMAPRTSR